MATIIGVASPAPRQVLVRTSRPTMYMLMRPVPDYVSVWVRTASPLEVAADTRRALAAIDPDLPPLAIRTLEDHYAADAAPLTLIAKASSGLGSVSLLLAISGVYSVMAFFVALRTNEFGVRVALGARASDITGLVIRQAGRLVGYGLAAGTLFGAPLLVGLHAAFPFTQPFDPLVVAPAAAVLLLTAIAAAWLPARRAARVDPLLALRAE
jgi:ABC-type antimicrobial peptide transport system permease subunit